DGTRHRLRLNRVWRGQNEGGASYGSVIKDAGDDPDVTHGIEIIARVAFTASGGRGSALSHRRTGLPDIAIKGGQGVGVVTRPGLPVPIGAPAINPVPMGMIREAVGEALGVGSAPHGGDAIEVVI